jgi:hypothetical protein
MRSNRILSQYDVDRETAGEVTLRVPTCDGETELVTLTADDLRALLAFAERGEEPPETEAEKVKREKGEKFGAFLNSLLLPPEPKG